MQAAGLGAANRPCGQGRGVPDTSGRDLNEARTEVVQQSNMKAAARSRTRAGWEAASPWSVHGWRHGAVIGGVVGATGMAGLALGGPDWEGALGWAGGGLILGSGVLAAWAWRRIRALELALSRVRESAEESRVGLAADLGHELRTPLHGVIGMLSLMRGTSLDPTQADYLDGAWNSANHLMAVLNNVVDLARIGAGKLALELEAVDVGRLVRDLGGLAVAMTKAKGLGFRTRVDETVPRWARLDATRMRQVLYNLLSNAVKYSERGEVVLAVGTGLTAEGTMQLRFMVKDHGVGMDGDTVALLFQRFSRGRPMAGKPTEGAGLGLQISMALARLMGGEILVASEPGAGSTFELVVPCQPCSEPEVESARNGELVVAAGTMRVLVVEDHPVNRQYLEMVLERLGHDAVICRNGPEALEAMAGGSFDVALMDIRMNGMDGFETTRRLREMVLPGETLRVVALTADVSAEARRLAEEAGMDDFLAKPVSPGELGGVLERHGGRNKHQAGKNGGCAVTTARADSLVSRAVVDDLCESMGFRGYHALVFGLCDERGATMQALRRALDAGDVPAIRDGAHGVKGAAMTLGLGSLAAAAEGIGKAAEDAAARAEAWSGLVALIHPSREEALAVAGTASKKSE